MKVDPFAVALTAVASGFTAYVIGEIFDAQYAKLNPEQQAHWDQNRLLHHGMLGVIMTGAGLLLLHPVYTPLISGAGFGLIISDKEDFVEGQP